MPLCSATLMLYDLISHTIRDLQGEKRERFMDGNKIPDRITQNCAGRRANVFLVLESDSTPKITKLHKCLPHQIVCRGPYYGKIHGICGFANSDPDVLPVKTCTVFP